MAGPEIDAVFTWVDGGRRPDLDAWRARSGSVLAAEDSGANRWRDNGELRYALRSLAVNAPWLRRVHLVTAGEVPDWLDPSAPGLRLVTHAEIFPDPSVLPTFNSAAIVAVLHRIPDLADRYLYLNDDVILGRPVVPSDFVTDDGGTKVHVEPWPPPSSLTADNVVDRQLAFNALLLDGHRARMLAHTAHLFEKDRVEDLWRRFRPRLQQTLGHHFRTSADFVLPFVYLNRLLADGPPHRAVENHGHARLVRVGWHADLPAVLAGLRTEWPMTICVNDDVADVERDGWMWDAVRAFLDDRLPSPSPYERPTVSR